MAEKVSTGRAIWVGMPVVLAGSSVTMAAAVWIEVTSTALEVFFIVLLTVTALLFSSWYYGRDIAEWMHVAAREEARRSRK